jgi:hypothetical protein
MFSPVRPISFSLDSPRSVSPTKLSPPPIDVPLIELSESFPRSPLSPREIPLVDHYFKERDDIHNHQGVEYIAAESLDPYKVRFNDMGQAIDYSNQPINNSKSIKKTNIPLALVLNQDQTLHYIDLEKGKTHHSSLSSGQSVLWAAEVTLIKNGYFKIITDQSGHYRPNLRQFLYGLEQLKIMGADLSNTKITLNAFDEYPKTEFGDINCEALLKLYIKNGFKSNEFIPVNIETLAEAKQHFINNQSEIPGNTAVYFIKEVNDLYKLELQHENESLESTIKSTSYRNIYTQNNKQYHDFSYNKENIPPSEFELSLGSLSLTDSPVKPLILSSAESSPKYPRTRNVPAAKQSARKKLF